MPSRAETPVLQPLSSSSMELVFGADSQIYPSPLPLSVLASWVKACPNFAFQYRHPGDPGKVVGICITLPVLKLHWDDLVSGRIHEWDIAPSMLWRGGGGGECAKKAGVDDDVGLHIWHIERLSGWQRAWGAFGKYVWDDVSRGLLDQPKGPNVMCYSALAVTEDGMRLFRDRLGWKESPCYQGQWVVSSGVGENRVAQIVEKKDWLAGVGVEAVVAAGLEVIGDCRMLVGMREEQCG